MNHMPIEPAVLLSIVGVPFLAVAAWFNWREARVPNKLVLAFLLSFIALAWRVGISPEETVQRAVVFAGTGVCFAILFAWAQTGGGAVKLVAVTTLWLPPTVGVVFAATCLALVSAVYCASRLSESEWIETTGLQFSTIVALLGIAFMLVAL